VRRKQIFLIVIGVLSNVGFLVLAAYHLDLREIGQALRKIGVCGIAKFS